MQIYRHTVSGNTCSVYTKQNSSAANVPNTNTAKVTSSNQSKTPKIFSLLTWKNNQKIFTFENQELPCLTNYHNSSIFVFCQWSYRCSSTFGAVAQKHHKEAPKTHTEWDIHSWSSKTGKLAVNSELLVALLLRRSMSEMLLLVKK